MGVAVCYISVIMVDKFIASTIAPLFSALKA